MAETITVPKYYSNVGVQYRIIYQTFNREFTFAYPKGHEEGQTLKGVYRVHNTQHFEWIMKNKVRIEDRDMNLFTSIARYQNGVPYRHGGDIPNDWLPNSFKEIEAIDCFIDIDSSPLEHDAAWLKAVILSTQFVTQRLNELECPFELRFSGKGFHIVIPFRAFLMNKERQFYPKDKDFIMKTYQKIGQYFKQECTELIDFRVIQRLAKIKIPFTIAHYPSAKYVCTPIQHLAELEFFKLEDYTPQAVFNRINKYPVKNQKVFNPTGNAIKLLEEINAKVTS